MIRLPSNQRTHETYVSFDEAFVQPPELVEPPELADGATDEQRAAREKALEEAKSEHEEALKAYAHKIKVARETGKWDELRVGDKQPTKFLLRPMPADGMSVITGMHARKEPGEEILTLAFRLCVVGVESFGKYPVEFVNHKRFGKIATTSFLDKTLKGDGGALLSWRIIAEIGSYALARAYGNPT